MISVENFYWTLFENLLKPAGLRCSYYYPWGTRNSHVQDQFDGFHARRDYNHVFFHFDQEPLWSEQLGPYDLAGLSWSNKWAKILANSEHSGLKKRICKSRGLIDWYFFYHGFAALDWYRDARYIKKDHRIQNAFLSLNHNFDRRDYRVALLARLLQRDIAHKGSISFHATLDQIQKQIQDPYTNLSAADQNLIANQSRRLADLPWQLDQVPVNGNLSARFGHEEYELWQRSLLHLVNETVFYEDKLHLTEKIFKPIVAMRPFLLVAAPGNLRYLRTYGFQTFGAWIDESYDDIQDPDLRLVAIVEQTARFAEMSQSQLQDVYHDMMPVITHNKEHFFGAFRHVIVDELVENFQQCIRIWNNGALDMGKNLCLLEDVESVKKILCR